MIYAIKSTAAEDMVQLVDSANAPVTGLVYTDVTVKIRKNGAGDFSAKALVSGDFTASGTSGMYIIKFTASELDTAGLFRYQITSASGSAFVNYEDAIQVVASYPATYSDPPTINAQTATPAGISPDPVEQGSSTLTISGQNLTSATVVTVNSISCTITGTTVATGYSTVACTIGSNVPLGSNVAVVVTTAGGSASSTVDVVLATADIPGSGMCIVTGKIYNPGSGQPLEKIGVYGRVLDMPNISDGVGWTDDVISVSTDTDGKFSLTLPRSKRVEVTIPRIRYRRVMITPNLATADLFTQIP